jgi:hypothetical protein
MSESRRYWYPGADGEPAGPLDAQGIRQCLASGTLRRESPLCVEGTTEWRPAGEFPELAEVAAAAPPKPAVAPAASGPAVPTPAVPAKPSLLKPVPYTAGARPAAAGPFLTYSHPLDEIGALLDSLRAFDQPPPEVPRIRWRPRLLLCGGLLLLAAAAAVVDLSLGLPRSPFTYLIPFAAAAILLVVAATGAPRPRPAWMKNKGPVGCVFALFVLPMVSALSTYAMGNSLSEAPSAWLVGAVLLVVVVVLMDNRESVPVAPRYDLSRMEVCREVAAALEHDALPGKPASGWLDLTGPRQGSKVCREGNAASGRHIRLYRDEWWRLTLPLRDGNRLRISAVERVKVKDAVRRRRKTKPEVEETIGTIEVKLGVNTAEYRTLPEFTPASVGRSLVPGPIVTRPDTVTTSARVRSVTDFKSQDVLALLALVYARLERLKPDAGGAP